MMNATSSYRPQSNWGLDLGAPAAPQAPAYGGSPVAQAPSPYSQPIDWNNWSGKGQVFDYGYDAYMFSKFPLSLGGVGFWTGGGIRRKIASMFSKIPEDRLITLQVRHQFMRVPNMRPDYARLMQMAYYQAASTNPGVAQTHPLQWMAQFGQGGGINDFLVRGPLMVELGLHAGQVAMQFGFAPDVPSVDTIEALAQGAGRIVPPPQVAPPRY